MKNYNAEIGTWLAKKREEKGLSQSDVAKRMNVTKSAVHYWETSFPCVPDLADTCVFRHFSAFSILALLTFSNLGIKTVSRLREILR